MLKSTELHLGNLKPDSYYEFHVVAENMDGQGYVTKQKLQFHTMPASLQSLRIEKKEQKKELKLYAWGDARNRAMELLPEDMEDNPYYSEKQQAVVRPHRLSAFA